MAKGDTRLVDSTSNWSGGVDSSKVATMASPEAPQGLLPFQTAWLINSSCRGGGIQPRGGWAKRATMPLMARFQGCWTYSPIIGPDYAICSIGGHILKVDLETYEIIDLSEQFQLFNPADVEKAFGCQGEQFLVIQAGDYITLPLFWDGMALVRSRGYVPPTAKLNRPTFTVPAIGGAVLATLDSPYMGATNEIFMIDGYQYQQVLRTQRYDINARFYWVGAAPLNVNWPFNAGMAFPSIGAATDTATMLRGGVLHSNVDNNGTYVTGQSNDPFFFTSDTLSVAGLDYGVTNWQNPPPANYVSTIQIQLTHNDLVAPGANQVWLINIDDPRTGVVVTPPAPGQDSFTQLPAAGPMDYYMGRFWLANGREYLAGDIVGGPSGSARYQYRDSILYVEENTYLAGGGTFAVPTNAGNITALRHNASLDTATGEGILFVFTSQSVFSCNVTPVRTEWVTLKEPLQRVVQINHGTTSDRSIVAVNGDLFFRRIDGVGSLITAIRYFNQWANPPLSNEEQRVISADDETLLSTVSGIEFDSKLLMTCLPVMKDVGTAFRGIMPLDFLPVASAREQMRPPWEGLLEGLDILQLLKGNFSGEDRAFAFIHSRYSGNIELWEITRSDKDDTNDSGAARTTWIIETPGYVFRNPNQLKQLETARLWIDRLYGKVDFTLYWRNDQAACWNHWNSWSQCAARNNCEDPEQEFCSVPNAVYKEQYRRSMKMPKPAGTCDQQSDCPSDFGYSFQLRLVIKGFCRLRGIFLYAWPRTEEVFADLVCVGDVVCGTCTEGMPGPPGLTGAPGSGMRRYVLAIDDPNGVVNGNQGDEVKSLTDGRLWTKISAGSGNSGWE